MSSPDHIITFFNSKFPFNHEGLAEFAGAFTERSYPKGHLLATPGDSESELRFLESGIVRDYFSHQGREMNTQFYLEHEFITDFNLLINRGERRKFQECLSPVTLRVLDRDVFFQFMEKYQCGKELVHEIFRRHIERNEADAYKHFSLTPDELYLDLLERKPRWLQSIPLYHIATYLRMTPETLSRIRKRT